MSESWLSCFMKPPNFCCQATPNLKAYCSVVSHRMNELSENCLVVSGDSTSPPPDLDWLFGFESRKLVGSPFLEEQTCALWQTESPFLNLKLR